MEGAADLASLFDDVPTEPVLVEPENLTAAEQTSDVKKLIFQEKVKRFVQRLDYLEDNVATLYAVIWGQCSDDMKARVKTHDNYKDATKKNNCVWLLGQIKAITLQFDSKKDSVLCILHARKNFANCRQQQGQSVEDYAETLTGWANTLKAQGDNVSVNYDVIPMKDADGKERSTETRQKMAYDLTMARALVDGADQSRYGTLITELANQHAKGRSEYPINMVSAKSLLTLYKTPTNAACANSGSNNPGGANRTTASASVTTSGTTFAQRAATGTSPVPTLDLGPLVPGTDGRTLAGLECWTCHREGHHRDECPGPPTTPAPPVTLTQHAFMLAQADGHHGIDPTWILLDSQSTISVFRNADYLTNIRRSEHVLRALTNGGHQDSHMVGEFPNLGPVWYNTDSIANILSLADVRKVCRVTMDTSTEAALVVHRADGTTMKFEEHLSGLYIYKPNNTNSNVTGYTLVSTVAEQKRMFSRREVTSADTARDLYRKIGRPDETEFAHILKRNFIRDCPVTPDDAKRALIIYGPDIATIKGKTTRSAAAPRAPTFVAEPIPAPVLKHHRNVTLCADFFFVQGLPFFHNISRAIGFRTAHPVLDRAKSTILRRLRDVIGRYQARGLTICDVHADSELECVRDSLLPIEMNIVPADCHVGEVERSIRTIKERLRSCAHGLPFKRLPRLLVQHMVADVVRCLNQFPRKNGISDTMSPATIVTGVGHPSYSSMRLEFGTYVQVFEDNDPTNTLRARSLGAIALTPTGNAQGDYNFMSLATGHKISRHNWTVLPMTDTAIARVEAIAFHEDQPLLQQRGLVVEWRPDQPIDESEYDIDFRPPAEPADFFDVAAYDPVDADELADLLDDAAPPPYHPADPIDAHHFNNDHLAGADAQGAILVADDDDEDDDNDNNVADDDDDGDDDDEDDDNNNNNNNNGDDFTHDDDTDAGNDGDDNNAEEGAPDDAERGAPDNNAEEGAPDDEDAAEDDDNAPGQGAHTYNLRARTTNPGNQFKQAMDEPHDSKSYYPPVQLLQATHPTKGTDNIHKYIFGYIMNQMTAKAGIKKHGQAAVAALMSEFAQLEDLTVYEIVDAAKLTRRQRKMALRAINLIKEKRDGKIKGRTVADGRAQRGLYEKSQTASPTVATDALMLSIMIDAYEGRDVATADVAGAYLKAFMDDLVIIKYTGESVDILCNMKPEYEKFVVVEKGVKVLYARLIKALYGCVKSA